MDKDRIVRCLHDLYCYEVKRYFFMYPPDGAYKPSEKSLTYHDLRMHINNRKTICVSGRKYHTKFMCFDVDEQDPEHIHLLIDKIESAGIPRDRVYVSTSGGKGYHIDIFFDKPVFKSEIENFFNEIRRDPAIEGINMECRPQKKKTIKIPLGWNFKTEKKCWYVDRETLEPIEDMEYVFGIEKISGDMFHELVHNINKKKLIEDIKIAKSRQSERAAKAVRTKVKPSNVPIITGPGQRHEKMLKYAVWLRTGGYDRDEIYDELMRWVSKQNPGYISSSTEDIERDAGKIAYDVTRAYEPREFSESVKPVGNEKRVLKADDIRRVLAAGSKSDRKVAMLIIAHCRVFGNCRLGYERLAEITGVSKNTAQSAVNRMLASKLIVKNNVGGRKFKDGEPVMCPNEYMLGEGGEAADVDVSHDVEFNIDEVTENFDKFYYEALASVCTMQALHKYLSKSEVQKIKEGNTYARASAADCS